MTTSPDIPQFVFVGIDAKNPRALIATAFQRLVDVVTWCKEDPEFRRFFTSRVNNGTALWRASREPGDMEPVQAGSITAPN